ncbi:uncharacterized protein susd5 [Xenentodon cancila]
MVNRFNQTVLSLLFGCLVCLLVTSVANADGRVFVLDLRNSSSGTGFRDAEQACTAHRAHLASEEELFHAVVECFVSQCTRGWLYGGTVGTTVCNIVSGSVKAVDVRTENATEDTAHLAAFCIKDKDMPCGDPPSFPNVRLQEHSGFEMGDELLYTCVPGHVMPSGHTAFSLLCDSCGEWYGRVQMCVKGLKYYQHVSSVCADEAESHIDYEDMHTDSYEEADQDRESPEDTHEEVYEEEYGGAHQDAKNLNQQVSRSIVEVDEAPERDLVGKVIDHSREFEGAVEEGAKSQEHSHEDFTDHPRLEQERSGMARTDAAAATEEPVSLLSQKHLFWFPSEAFQEEGAPISTVSATHTTQRASGAQSGESKEHDSHERSQQPHPVDVDDHDDDQEDHDDDNDDKDDRDINDDDLYDDKGDTDSHQEDHVKHPTQHDNLDRLDQHKDQDDHDDHYDMGEHEEDRDRVYYGSREIDDRDDSFDEHQSFGNHDDKMDDHVDNEGEHVDGSEEHPDRDNHDDGDEHPDFEDDSHPYTDHDDHDDHKEEYDDPDSHEDDDAHVSVAAEGRQNITQSGAADKAAKDETWLDGYPVVLEETGESTTDQMRPLNRETVVKTPDRRNEVEIRKPVPYTSSPDEHESPPGVPDLDQDVVEKVWPGFTGTPGASPEHFQPSDTPSYLDTLDYDTQQVAPTHSWLDDLTEHPFLDHGPAPPVHDGDIFAGEMGEHTAHNLPNETGEMGDLEGEMGEAICVGEDCPPQPPSSSSRGPKVAAIIVAVCALATAVIVGLWCYRRQQQKSSVYEMNGKGQSQSRQGQQIEMQQKV